MKGVAWREPFTLGKPQKKPFSEPGKTVHFTPRPKDKGRAGGDNGDNGMLMMPGSQDDQDVLQYDSLSDEVR